MDFAENYYGLGRKHAGGIGMKTHISFSVFQSHCIQRELRLTHSTAFVLLPKGGIVAA